MLCKDKKKWYGSSLISEICLCTPCFIARPEQYFSQLKLVKTDQHTVLTSKSLSVILRIKLRPNLLMTFHDQMSTRSSRIGTFRKVGDWIKEKEKNTKNQIPRKNLVTIRFENFMLDIDDDSSTDNDSDDLRRCRQCILSLLCWVNFILMIIYKQFIWTNFGVFSKSNLLIFDQKFCLKSTHKYHFIMKK